MIVPLDIAGGAAAAAAVRVVIVPLAIIGGVGIVAAASWFVGRWRSPCWAAPSKKCVMKDDHVV